MEMKSNLAAGNKPEPYALFMATTSAPGTAESVLHVADYESLAACEAAAKSIKTAVPAGAFSVYGICVSLAGKIR